MNKLNIIQKTIRFTGILVGVMALLTAVRVIGLNPGFYFVKMLPLAFILMAIDIGIAISKRLIKGENK